MLFTVVLFFHFRDGRVLQVLLYCCWVEDSVHTNRNSKIKL